MVRDSKDIAAALDRISYQWRIFYRTLYRTWYVWGFFIAIGFALGRCTCG